MDPEYVRRRLRLRADDVHRSLLLEYGETPERERTVDVSGPFPETPEDLFPWATVTVLTDPARERTLVVESATEADWEPPGGRGNSEESVAVTARRGAAEAVGVDSQIGDLLLLERLSFDYGRADGLTAPVVQAVFHAVVDPVPETTPPETTWFDRDALPEAVRFRASVLRALDDPG